MATTAAQPRKKRSPIGTVLVVVGLLAVIGAAVYGFIAIGSPGAGELDTVPLGTRVTFTAAASGRASIFMSGDQVRLCRVITADGREVNLGDARPYMVNEQYQMQSIYGFDVSQGATYLVTCGSPGDAGEFAVVGFPSGPEHVAIAVGSLGGAAFIVGLVLVLIGQRRQRPSTKPA